MLNKHFSTLVSLTLVRLTLANSKLANLTLAASLIILPFPSAFSAENNGTRNGAYPTSPSSKNPLFRNNILESHNPTPYSFIEYPNGRTSPYRVTGTRYGNPEILTNGSVGNDAPGAMSSADKKDVKIEVFYHGFTQTGHAMRTAAQEAVSASKLVFLPNHVGAGPYGYESEIRQGVNHEAVKDGFVGAFAGLEQTLHGIQKNYGAEKLNLTVYSEGTMLAREYFSGTIAFDDKMIPIRSLEVARQRQSQIGHVVMMGGPPYNISGIRMDLLILGSLLGFDLNTVHKEYDGKIPLGMGGETRDLSKASLVGRVHDVLRSFGLGIGLNAAMSAAGNVQNFGENKERLKWVLATEHSDPTSELVRDFVKMKGLKDSELPPFVGSIEEDRSSANLPSSGMEITMVVGGKDQLANVDELLREYAAYYLINPKRTRFIFLPDVGHMDLIWDEVQNGKYGLAKLLEDIKANPEKFQPTMENPFLIVGKKGLTTRKNLETRRLEHKFRGYVERPETIYSHLGSSSPSAAGMTCESIVP